MHNEVSALERAYNDNEVRIRDLLSELSNQRETLVNQADQVRKAIGAVHLDLSHDITSVGDLVAEKVNDVAQRVTRTLTEKGEHITLALGHAGDSMIDALGERGSSLLERLESTSDRATSAIGSASERLSQSLNFKTDHIHDEYTDMAARLQQMMTARLEQVAQGFAQKTQSTVDAMASRSQQLTDALSARSEQYAAALAKNSADIADQLAARSEALVQTIGVRGGDVVERHLVETFHLGAVAFKVFLLAAGGDRRQRAAVEGALEGDDAVALRLAVDVVVAARRLDGAFQRLGAGIGEEHLVGEGGVRQPFTEPRLPRDLVEIGDMPQFGCLLGERGDQVRMAMAERIHGDAAGEIEISLALFGHQPSALPVVECKGCASKGLVKRRTAHYMRLRNRKIKKAAKAAAFAAYRVFRP